MTNRKSPMVFVRAAPTLPISADWWPNIQIPTFTRPPAVSSVGSTLSLVESPSLSDVNAAEITDVENVADSEDDVQPPSKCRQGLLVLLKCFAKFLVVAGFLVMGAFMFQYLEISNEISGCYQTQEAYAKSLNETATRFMAMLQTKMEIDVAADVIIVLLNRFGRNICMFAFNPYKNCSEIGQSGATYFWSFPNSLMFSLTVISTIGYGYLFPRTYWGKLVMIAYAVIGIPVIVIFLAAIGDILGKSFRYLYANLCCCVLCIRCKSDSGKSDNSRRSRQIAPANEKQSPQRMRVANGTTLRQRRDDDEDTADDLEKTVDSFQVPITFLLIIVAAFLLVGVGVFLDQDWLLLDCVYFCFISLATIGLGDYVPNRDQPDTSELLTKTVIAMVYILIGMAILSMCLNLIQDDMVDKFQWLMQKLRCNKKRCCKKN